MNMVVLKHLLRNEEMGAYDKACNNVGAVRFVQST